MLLLGLVDAGLFLLGAVVSLFGFAGPLNLPAALSLTVPVPMAGTAGVSVLNAWWPVAVGTAVALTIGRALQWLYGLIPFKMT